MEEAKWANEQPLDHISLKYARREFFDYVKMFKTLSWGIYTQTRTQDHREFLFLPDPGEAAAHAQLPSLAISSVFMQPLYVIYTAHAVACPVPPKFTFSCACPLHVFLAL